MKVLIRSYPYPYPFHTNIRPITFTLTLPLSLTLILTLPLLAPLLLSLPTFPKAINSTHVRIGYGYSSIPQLNGLMVVMAYRLTNVSGVGTVIELDIPSIDGRAPSSCMNLTLIRP